MEKHRPQFSILHYTTQDQTKPILPKLDGKKQDLFSLSPKFISLSPK